FHFTDANPNASAADFTATVDWGDGMTESSASSGNVLVVASAGSFDVVGSHTYAEEGSGLPFRVSVADKGGSSTSAAGTGSVADAALAAGALTPPAAVEGQPVSGAVLFHFSDANPNANAGDFTATVNWGDGTTESSAGSAHVSVVASAGGGFDVVRAHTYPEEASSLPFTCPA